MPAPLEAIDVQLLAKDPSQRYASAEDLRADLRNYLEGLPVSALRSPAALAAGLAVAPRVETATQAVPTVAPAPVVAPTPTPAAAAPADRSTSGSTRFLWVLLVVFAVMAIGLFYWGTQLNSTANAQIEVNKVTGLSEQAATDSLTAQGFKVTPKSEANADVDAGTVFAQDPGPGQKADKGSVVTITVSSGAGQVEVPDVTGKTVAQAQSLLTGAKFVVKTTPRQDPTVDKDTVISQNPAGHAMADLGSTVEIIVSSGPSTVQVPDVTGQSAATATATLVAAGFKVTAIDQSSTTVNVGRVISTNPDGGTDVAPGSTVKIYVSTGPPSTTTSSSTTTTKSPPTSSTTTTKASTP